MSREELKLCELRQLGATRATLSGTWVVEWTLNEILGQVLLPMHVRLLKVTGNSKLNSVGLSSNLLQSVVATQG